MDTSNFVVKRSKFKVTVGPTCWKMHDFSEREIWKITRLNFKLSVLIHFGTGMNAPTFGVNKSKVKVTAGGGMQSSMLCIEFLISVFTS